MHWLGGSETQAFTAAALKRKPYRCTGFDDKVVDRELLAVLGQASVQLLPQLHQFVNPAVDGEVVVGHCLLGLQQPLGCDAPDLAVGDVCVVI